MLFTVVAVGDGACSVVRGWPRSDVMLIDCGTAGNCGVSASETLAFELGWDVLGIDTVVVTHFDADHWRGLRELPTHWAGRPLREVEFRYPAFLPGDAGQIQLAYVALQARHLSGPLFGALDLMGSWERAGVTVTRRPSIRGDWFIGGGSAWRVHWPPADDGRFTPRTRKRMRALAGEVRGVAETVSEFRKALEAVQLAWLSDDIDAIYDDHPLNMITGEEVGAALVDELGEVEFDRFAKRVRKFTNELSMVHSNDRIANFGDCEKAGLEALIAMEATEPTLQKSYPVILAPHHGTVTPSEKVRKDFPRASQALVSQNGKVRYDAGRESRQLKFKDAVTADGARKVDTHDPRNAPSLVGPHVRMWLPYRGD